METKLSLIFTGRFGFRAENERIFAQHF